ncbi:hypothetical protein ACU4GD_19510 [Cupriavidus basilensis]
MPALAACVRARSLTQVAALSALLAAGGLAARAPRPSPSRVCSAAAGARLR